MVNNQASRHVHYIREKLNSGLNLRNLIIPINPRLVTIINTIDAYWQWYELVKTDGDWDHKKDIIKFFGHRSFDSQGSKRTVYPFDIWSNIHYGYVGLAANIPEWSLLEGAGVAQIIAKKVPAGVRQRLPQNIRNSLNILAAWDAPHDQASIKVGFELWRSAGKGVTKENILNAVRLNAARLDSQRCS
jgi:hypothetical protein